jgi:hypothetical protein
VLFESGGICITRLISIDNNRKQILLQFCKMGQKNFVTFLTFLLFSVYFCVSLFRIISAYRNGGNETSCLELIMICV